MEATKQHCEETGRWFLESSAFSDWKSKPNSFLWLYGIPGCGKTILSSTIIDALRSNSSSSQVLLYFYFTFRDTDKQSLDSMLRSLISQLCHAKPRTQGSLDGIFKGNQQPTTKSLKSVLDDMIRQIGEVWIVIDALDESRTEQDLLKWISGVIGSKPDTKIIVTARDVIDIRSIFRQWARQEDMISIQHDDVDGDIRTYIRSRLRGDAELKRWHSRLDVQEEIEKKLMDKANGM